MRCPKLFSHFPACIPGNVTLKFFPSRGGVKVWNLCWPCAWLCPHSVMEATVCHFKPRPERPLSLFLTLLEPCHHHTKKPGLTCCRVTDRVGEESAPLLQLQPQICARAQPRSAEPLIHSRACRHLGKSS